MANKHSRAGGKYSGNHTTLTPAAALITDIVHTCTEVTKISPGFLKGGLRPAKGGRRVKITDDRSRLLLSVRDNTSHQEIHVYTTDNARAQEKLVPALERAGFSVTTTSS